MVDSAILPAPRKPILAVFKSSSPNFIRFLVCVPFGVLGDRFLDSVGSALLWAPLVDLPVEVAAERCDLALARELAGEVSAALASVGDFAPPPIVWDRLLTSAEVELVDACVAALVASDGASLTVAPDGCSLPETATEGDSDPGAVDSATPEGCSLVEAAASDSCWGFSLIRRDSLGRLVRVAYQN